MKKNLLIGLTYLMLLASCGKEIKTEDIIEKKDKIIDYEESASIRFESGVTYDLKRIVYKDETVKSFFKLDGKVMFDQEYLNVKLPQFPKELSEMMKLLDEHEVVGNDEDAYSVFSKKYKIRDMMYQKTKKALKGK
jgi:hypothetical protein